MSMPTFSKREKEYIEVFESFNCAQPDRGGNSNHNHKCCDKIIDGLFERFNPNIKEGRAFVQSTLTPFAHATVKGVKTILDDENELLHAIKRLTNKITIYNGNASNTYDAFIKEYQIKHFVSLKDIHVVTKKADAESFKKAIARRAKSGDRVIAVIMGSNGIRATPTSTKKYKKLGLKMNYDEAILEVINKYPNVHIFSMFANKEVKYIAQYWNQSCKNGVVL